MLNWRITLILTITYICFAQIAQPFLSRFIRVFQDNGVQVLSADVSTNAVYSNMTITITTNTPFFATSMYYLLADAGACVLCVGCVCVGVRVHRSEYPYMCLNW